MSAPFGDPTQLVPLAVLVASLAGSLHCASMCGGLVASLAPTPRLAVAYHLGRLVGYSTLGALAGLFGDELGGSNHPWLSVISAALLGALLVAAGIKTWRGKSFHLRLPRFLARAQGAVWSRACASNHPGATRFAAGALSAVLPCGWLYTFVLGAAATGSAARGAWFMAFFWMGTLPALSALSAIARRFFAPIRSRAPRVAALLLVLAGLATIAVKVAPAFEANGSGKPASAHSCH